MQAVLLIGLPASGKTSFYIDRFLQTHVRLSLDVLATRKREAELFLTCLRLRQRVVIDNTNVSVLERAAFIAPARSAGFSVVGYHLDSDLSACLSRNAGRIGKACIREEGLYSAAARFSMPMLEEGFDQLHRVRMTATGFKISTLKERRAAEPFLDRSWASNEKDAPSPQMDKIGRTRTNRIRD